MTSSRLIVQRLLRAGVSSLGLALLAASCMSTEGTTEKDGNEPISTASQPLICSCGRTCPADNDCATFSCEVLSEDCCVATPLKKEGEDCVGSQRGQIGVCLQNQCCFGCVAKLKNGTVACAAGTAVTACGSDGKLCRSCNDRNPCTADNCEAAGRCGSTPITDRTSCPNGLCYGGVCCTGCIDEQGVCQPGNLASACGAAGEACRTCEDDDLCTDDVCVQGQCAYPKKADGASCETDEDICNGKSTCHGGQCKTGVPLGCDDSNPCTDDGCDPQAGCTTVNNAANCEDGNPCTIRDKCSEGRCKAGEPVVCDDNEFCTDDDGCDPTRGCVYTPKADGTECEDGNACTRESACYGGTCRGDGELCDDQNPCTLNGCTLSGGCNHAQLELAGTPCLGKDKCSLNGQCDDRGTCSGGVAKDCNDNNPCTKDICDIRAASCVNLPLESGPCSDASPCTVNDRCRDGLCQANPIVCVPLDDCHVPGRCDEATGVCSDPLAKDGAACEAGTGTCWSGRCITNPLVVLEGGAGGAPVTIEGGSDTGAPAGEGGAGTVPAQRGAGGEPGNTGSGMGGSSIGGSAGTFASGRGPTSGTDDRGDASQRESGGCSCSLNRTTSSTTQVSLLLSLLGLGALRRQRSRTAQATRR